jgi:hypothetical protein
VAVHVRGSVLHYFAEGNTARGSISLYDSSLQDVSKLYILKGGPGNGKSTLIRSIGDMMVHEGFDIWQLRCARDHASFDGVIVPGLKLGIVDGTAPHAVEPVLPGVTGQIVNLGEAWNEALLFSRRQELQRLRQKENDAYEQAYAGFAQALKIHDDWEAVYIENLDVEAVNRLGDEWIDKLFGGRTVRRTPRVDRRFLGAATPGGAVDFIPNLTAGLSRRFFLKGRPGCGKSTLLKKLAAAASERGFDVEIYHCGFDPGSVDMIIVRSLGFAVFDSTKPHEYFPERDGDEIIDLYELCVRRGTDERYETIISACEKDYSAAMKRSIGWLKTAHEIHLKMEKIYGQATDFSLVNQMRDRIAQEIRTWIRQQQGA